MVSFGENEETWSDMQKQLSSNRKIQLKKNKTYEKIHANRLTPRFDNKPPNLDRKPLNLSKNRPKNNNQTDNNNNMLYANNSPLNTPATFRNQHSAGRNDPYGINPLPNIRSPFPLYQPYPNLESWGIVNKPFVYDDPFTLYRNTQSPFLPVYNSLKKTQKPYLVVPNLQNTSPLATYDEFNPRFNYIAARPYNPRDYSPPLLDRNPLRSDELVKNAQSLLSKSAHQKEDNNQLFDTKFLEDLEFKSQTKPPTIRKKLVRMEPDADQYIDNIKKEADFLVPKPVYADTSQIYNTYAIDIAENLYKREVDMLVRELAEKTIEREENFRNSIQEPVYTGVYESTLNQMSKDVAREVLAEHEKQIQFLQNHEIKKVAKERIVNNLMLDTMLDKMAAHGKVVAENDDVTKLLDSMTLDVLLKTNTDVGKIKDKTIKNYPLKKFHLNSFMNVSLDILVAELSSSLEEDIKELDNLEIKNKKQF